MIVVIQNPVHMILGWISKTVNKERYMQEKQELYTLLEESIKKINEADKAKLKYIQTCNEMFDGLDEGKKRYVNFLKKDFIKKSEQADAIQEEYSNKLELYQKRYCQGCMVKNIKVYECLNPNIKDYKINNKNKFVNRYNKY